MKFRPSSLLLSPVLYLTKQTTTTAYTFTNKRALITGSSGGIGAGIAKTLAKKGARILLHYNTRYEGAQCTKEAILKEGGICDGIIQCNFIQPQNIRDMMDIVDDVWDNQIDILVNNAGVITKCAAEDDDELGSEWLDTVQVNLNAPYQLSRWAYKNMKKQKEGGSIINVSSIHGSSSVEYMTAYAASKAGMDRMTAGLSSEWAKDNVRVNVVAPGIVPVERTVDALSTKEAQDMWLPNLPVGRMGSVDEIAHGVVYLCENEWSSGSILTIDGGMTARANMPFRPKPPKVEKVNLDTESSEVDGACAGARYEK